MEVKCALCGRLEELTKIHKDYQKLAQEPEKTYICTRCTSRVQFQALESNKPLKPM